MLFAECHFAECPYAFTLSVIVLSAFMLNVVMVSVLAPFALFGWQDTNRTNPISVSMSMGSR
jgi:hypothetical protein